MRFSSACRTGLLAAALALAPAYSAPGDPDTLIDPEVTAVPHNGVQASCVLGFNLARGNERIAMSLTHFRVTPTVTARMLKVGHMTGEGGEVAPASAFLLTGDGDNRGDIVTAKPSDTPGYLLVIFREGAATQQAYAAIPSTGRIDVSLTLKGGKAQTWSADLGPRRDLREAWSKCVQEAVPARAA